MGSLEDIPADIAPLILEHLDPYSLCLAGSWSRFYHLESSRLLDRRPPCKVSIAPFPDYDSGGRYFAIHVDFGSDHGSVTFRAVQDQRDPTRRRLLVFRLAPGARIHSQSAGQSLPCSRLLRFESLCRYEADNWGVTDDGDDRRPPPPDTEFARWAAQCLRHAGDLGILGAGNE
ncbi:hypothetical protein ANO11243_036230 [Dothideomycetidae sp. 11243]|nr:hypothetical protein ANO11243_036230 [fungal sp. No.11243]